jgi:hypothetical protein
MTPDLTIYTYMDSPFGKIPHAIPYKAKRSRQARMSRAWMG